LLKLKRGLLFLSVNDVSTHVISCLAVKEILFVLGGMMYLEIEKKEHSDRKECSKYGTRALILHSEGIFVFSLHLAPLSYFRP